MTAVPNEQHEGALKAQRPARNGVGSSFAELDLPGFISQILGQYQDLLVHQVEQEVKSKALAAVKEQSRALYYQAKERLRSVEAEVQQKFQAVLQRAQERTFEMIQEEVEAIFSDLDGSFQTLLQDADKNPQQSQEVPTSPQVTPVAAEQTPKQGAAGEMVQASSAITPATLPEMTSPVQYVCLELPPPLSQRAVIEFYLGLSQTKEVQVLQVLGSVDRGILIHIRPRQAFALPPLLQTLPGVKEVAIEPTLPGAVRGKKGDATKELSIRVLLGPKDELGITHTDDRKGR